MLHISISEMLVHLIRQDIEIVLNSQFSYFFYFLMAYYCPAWVAWGIQNEHLCLWGYFFLDHFSCKLEFFISPAENRPCLSYLNHFFIDYPVRDRQYSFISLVKDSHCNVEKRVLASAAD